MTTTDIDPSSTIHTDKTLSKWFVRAETWLDERGKPAWIAAMVLGFIFAWPLGLALLAYMIWSKRMFTKCSSSGRDRTAFRAASKSSGNSVFDAYKTDTLRRLEDEQRSFEAFLDRLRDAKDQAEFDQFMAERARTARPDTGTSEMTGGQA